MMRAINTAVALVMCSIVGAGLVNGVNDWLVAKLDRKRSNAWVAWLGVMGTARRVK